MSNDYLSTLKNEMVNRKFVDASYTFGRPLKDSDVIGFDIDHTLAIYNTKNMCRLLYKSFVDYLINFKHYPKEICLEKNEDFVVKASRVDLLIDLIKGNVLRLDSRKKIIRAYHGKSELSEQQIATQYKNSKYPNLKLGVNTRCAEHFFVKGNFEYNITSIFMVCVDAFDKGLLRKIVRNYSEIKDHIIDALIFNYILPTTFADFQLSGYFFPEMYKHPEKYFYKNYSAMNLLKKLKEQGKHMFFATNSFYTYAKFVLQNTVGEDFESVFDIGFYKAGKPLFYEDYTNENELKKLGINCLFMDGTKIDLLKNKEKLEDEVYSRIMKEKFLIGGSYHIIENYFKKMLNKDVIKVTYIGDDIIGDCGVPSKIKNWNAILINDSFMEKNYIGEKDRNFGSLWDLGYLEGKNYADVITDYFRVVAVALLPNVENVPLLC